MARKREKQKKSDTELKREKIKRAKRIRRIKVIGASLMISGSIFILGYICLTSGMKEIDKAKASAKWPTVEGTIVQSDLRLTLSSQDEEGADDDPLKNSTVIIYRYEVNGNTMMGNQVSWITKQDKEIAIHRSKKYPEGKQVKVFYNPDNPSISVLEPVYGNDLMILPAFGGVCIAISFLIGIIFWKYGNDIVEEIDTIVGDNIIFKVILGLLVVGAALLVVYFVKFK